MDWLNYHHLLYFWSVAKHGTISRACEELRLAQPTISGQIRALERSLGHKLFSRTGRHLVLTEVGRVVYRYAGEIFSLGKDLTDTLKGAETGRPMRLTVGVADVIPKLFTVRLLEAAFTMPTPVQITCWEGKLDRLLAELAVDGLDIVLADQPVPPTIKVQAYSHLIAESGAVLFASRPLAERYRPGFPRSLDGAPFLLPTSNATLRRSLDDWFVTKAIRPVVRGEFEDSATLKAFGQKGHGIFPAPAVMEREIKRQYRVEVVGRIPSLKQRFYAMTVERRLKHPVVRAIFESALQKLHT